MGLLPAYGDESAFLRPIDSKWVMRDFRGSALAICTKDLAPIYTLRDEGRARSRSPRIHIAQDTAPGRVPAQVYDRLKISREIFQAVERPSCLERWPQTSLLGIASPASIDCSH